MEQKHTARVFAFMKDNQWEYCISDGVMTTRKYNTRQSAWAAWLNGNTETLAEARKRDDTR